MTKRLRTIAAGMTLVGAVSVQTAALAQPASQPADKPAPATDKQQAEAKTRFQAGLQLYDDGAYEAARVEFERAYKLAPSYKILYNVGLVYKQLNEFVGALKALQQYLAEGGNDVPDDRRAEVQKIIDQLTKIIGAAEVTVNVPGAEITVDDDVVGKAPLSAPILLNPGRRKIGAKMAGKLPDAKVVTVASGDKLNIDLNLTEAVVIQQGTDVKPIIAWSVAGAFAIGAGVTGYLAVSAKNDREDQLKQAATRDDLDKALDKQQTLSVVSDVLTVGAIISVGVAVYFTFFNKPKNEAPKPAPADSPNAQRPAAIKVHPGVGSLLVSF